MQVGDSVSHYRIVEQIGGGGMGAGCMMSVQVSLQPTLAAATVSGS